jgi:glycosyltransferase involved in cell wall biosynthesis
MNGLILIFIHAYKRMNYLVCLLYSIALQTYQDFEVIITDDFPHHTEEVIIRKYAALPIRYFRITPALEHR